MNNALQLKRKSASSAVVYHIGKFMSLHLFRRPLTKGWSAGIRIIFTHARTLHKAEQLRKQEPKPILQTLSISKKIELGYRVWNALSTNPADFADPVPSMDDFKTTIDELYNAHYNYVHDAYYSNNGAPHRLRQVALNVCEYKFVEEFRLVMMYVDVVAMGRMEIYLKAGVDGVVRVG